MKWRDAAGVPLVEQFRISGLLGDDWIEFEIGQGGQPGLGGVDLTGNKFWDVSDQPQEFTLQGRVYEGQVGDESRPVEGVEIIVRGANSPQIGPARWSDDLLQV